MSIRFVINVSATERLNLINFRPSTYHTLQFTHIRKGSFTPDPAKQGPVWNGAARCRAAPDPV